MKLKYLTICSALGLFVVVAACESKNPATPLAPGSGEVSATNVTIASPTLASSDGAQIKNVNQPVTLTIGGTVSTGSSELTYTIEVATDTGFGNILYTKTGLAAGASQTIARLPPDSTYYWRARAMSGSSAGPNSKPRSFTIGPEVKLSTPVLASPGSDQTVGARLTLTVNNVQKTGPAGEVMYRFEVANSSSFASLVFEQTVPEQGGGATSVTLTTLANGTYWWRVQASDASNAVTTQYSASNPFRIQRFNLAEATMVNSHADFASWPQTATITNVLFTDNAILVDFDKRAGPGRWPESDFGVQYTLGLCLNINEHWFCSAAIQFWTDRELTASGQPSEISRNWYYDARWGPMKGYQPSYGELVGVFVGQGNLRGSGYTYKERSDVVIMPFGGAYRANSAFSAGMPSLLPFRRR